jgi:filamentous hemagglutinin family protein
MRYSCCPLFALAIALGCEAVPAIAQMQPNAGTTVDTMGNRLDIRGTQVSGKNQFHNFQTFNVNSGQTANFIPNNPNIQNILSRVTGGTPSQIQGMIQSANGVNLFLMNPSGILFGNGASLNVSGSFTATTANAIGFGNNLWFNAAGNNNTSALTSDPTQFAFTSNNPGAIVNTGNLTLPANQSLNLIGGTVINTGTIATPGGNITIAAVEGGKAVQISAPGSILSYTLPIESINAINPAIENPVSLPELLTGNPLDNASGVEIRNGVVTLVRSQTPLQDRSGLAVVSGTLTSSKITVAGKTIAVINPTLNVQDVSLTANDRIAFEDLGGAELPFGSNKQSVVMQTTSTNGIVESINVQDLISSSGTIKIISSRVNLGNLQAFAPKDDKVAIQISANQDIKVGNVTAPTGAIDLLSTNGNIKTGAIRSGNTGLPTTITAPIGNIEVDSIKAGVLGLDDGQTSQFSIDIFAGGAFKAIGTLADSYAYSLLNADASVFDFLASKTTSTPKQVRDAIPGLFSTQLYVLSPVSIKSDLGKIRIRYAGGGGVENKPIDGVVLQGGTARFEAGAKATIGVGDPYIPLDSTKLFSDFITNPFNITTNATYKTIVISDGASGTVGAIVRNKEVNGSFSTGLQDQAFGILPTKPDPKPDPRPDPRPDSKPENKTPTIDLETRNPSKLSSCPQTQTIAIAPIEATRSSESPTNPSTSSVSKNPCLTDNNEDEILKILK